MTARPIRTIPIPSEGLIRLSTVLAMFPVSRWEWKRGVKDGRYPAPVRLTPRVRAWNVIEIRSLINVTAQQQQPQVV
jgi:predicted DNA-binding transcriptional regulator AlpA